MDMTPSLANCPNDSSMKNSGIPVNTSITAYGIKNAPEMKDNV